MGNKNYNEPEMANSKTRSFQKRRYKPNQLFARLKQNKLRYLLENLKNWKFKLRRA